MSASTSCITNRKLTPLTPSASNTRTDTLQWAIPSLHTLFGTWYVCTSVLQILRSCSWTVGTVARSITLAFWHSTGCCASRPSCPRSPVWPTFIFIQCFYTILCLLDINSMVELMLVIGRKLCRMKTINPLLLPEDDIDLKSFCKIRFFFTAKTLVLV